MEPIQTKQGGGVTGDNSSTDTGNTGGDTGSTGNENGTDTGDSGSGTDNGDNSSNENGNEGGTGESGGTTGGDTDTGDNSGDTGGNTEGDGTGGSTDTDKSGEGEGEDTGDNESSVVTWANGTDDEITSMLESHYAGTIDISDYWAIGDVRRVSLSAIASGTTGEAQDAQDIDLVIIGLNHDTLATTNGTRTTAAITVQTKNCLTTQGYMNSAKNSTNYALWSNSKRRTWCNGVFISALPEYIQNLIKSVTKYSNTYAYKKTGTANYSSSRQHASSTDKCFLLSDYEASGKDSYNDSSSSATTTFGSLTADGTQYYYMKTDSNRIKYLGADGTTGTNWFTRTGVINANGEATFVNITGGGGTGGVGYASNDSGIAPAFCL
jgi:hypothetical protein